MDRRRQGGIPAETLGPPARIGQVGSEDLELKIEVLAPGPAREYVGVLQDPQACGKDAAGQGPLQVFGRELAESPFDHGTAGPLRVRTPGVQTQPAVAEVDPDQYPVGLELGRLHGKAHAIVEAQEDSVDVRDITAFGHAGGGAEGQVGPGFQRLRLRGCDLGLKGLGCEGCNSGFTPVYSLWAGHEDDGPGSTEEGGGGPA